jgi:hypothetical protein
MASQRRKKKLNKDFPQTSVVLTLAERKSPIPFPIPISNFRTPGEKEIVSKYHKKTGGLDAEPH